MKFSQNRFGLAGLCAVVLMLMTSPSSTAQQQALRFERSACSFEPPAGTAGLLPECGYLIVPEVREKPNGRKLKLAVAIYRAKKPSGAPPLLLLHGGPGGNGGIRGKWPPLQYSLARNRDIVIFDVRGAGLSEPQLCPGFYEGTAPVFNRRSRQEQEQGYNDAVRACVASLKAQGIEPSAYSTAINAGDAIDLRRALGYAKWDIYGVSYGGMLALELMRRDRTATHAVVLVSAGTGSEEEESFTYQRALERVFAACAVQTSCHTAFPTLEQDFYAVYDELSRSPMEVRIDTNRNPTTVWLDGERFLREVRDELVQVRVASLPLLINEFRRGDRVRAARRLLGDGMMRPWYPLGHLVACNDESVAEPAPVVAAKQKLRPGFQAILNDLRWQCEGWLTHPSRMTQSRIASDIPTLIVSGEIDPHGPDLYAQKLTAGFKHAYVFEVRGRAHEALGPCADSIIERFLEDPKHAPDASCLADGHQIAFVTRNSKYPLVLLITSSADVETPFAGEWQAEVPFPLGRSLLMELQTDGAAVTGVFRRRPSPPEPMPIFNGKVNGNTVTFKVKSPDGQRIITFIGTLTSDEIVFRREVEEQGPPSSRPTPGFFGTAGPQTFTAKRTKQPQEN